MEDEAYEIFMLLKNMDGAFPNKTESVIEKVAGEHDSSFVARWLRRTRQTGQCIQKNGSGTNGTQIKKKSH